MYSRNTDLRMKITVIMGEAMHSLKDRSQYISFLNVLSRFYRCSAENCLLILMQRPDSTILLGKRNWQEQYHRFIRNRETPVLITSFERLHKNGLQTRVPVQRILSVYDLSQTDGKPVPFHIRKDNTAYCGDDAVFLQHLCFSAPFSIVFGDPDGHAHSHFQQETESVIIARDLTDLQKIRALLIEIAMHDLKVFYRTDPSCIRNAAESCAYAVMKHYSMELEGNLFPDIHFPCELDRREQRGFLQEVRQCTAGIIKALEHTEKAFLKSMH